MSSTTDVLSPVNRAYTPSRWIILLFTAGVAGGVAYAGHQLFIDLSTIRLSSELPYLLLVIALVIALGFEFVNGFHDTANAVATVIYTHSLRPYLAVIWSACGTSLEC